MILSKEFHAQETTNIIFILYLCSHHPLASNYITWDSKDKMTTQSYVMHCKLHTVCNLKVKVVSYILLTVICITIFPSSSKKNICNTTNQWKQHTATEMRYSLLRYTAKMLFTNLALERPDFALKKTNKKESVSNGVIKAKQGSATYHHKQVLLVLSAADALS